MPSVASSYRVYPTYPPASLWSIDPSGTSSSALSPPIGDRSISRPFTISPQLYNNALHAALPITIAVLYAVFVNYANQYNKKRDFKPTDFSKSVSFYILVVVHNTTLALFSGWVFLGMFTTIKNAWPGWRNPSGLAGVADALCKINGPRGLGSAATYNTSTESWGFTDLTMTLVGGNPDTTDVGRMWNEGLGFYGWFFYLSKFYEIMDTMIILAKGKRSSFLQTYHHAGAMLCMWAGIRYMSPPIWMFTFINSGLHSLMYTYYTLSAFTIKIPPVLKRTLTRLQIAQIIFGGFYAAVHLFVAYDIPFDRPYVVINNLSTALPTAASTISSALSSMATSASAAGMGNWLKKAALRAAGEEGLAENVRNYQGETFGVDAIHAAAVGKSQEEVSYRSEILRTHCLDTSGQVFAIMLNLLYLAPLAYLFINFFYQSYCGRANAEPPKPTLQENAKKSADDALEIVKNKISEAMRDTQGGTTEPPPELKAELEDAKSRAKKATNDLNEKAQQKTKDASDGIKAINAKGQKAAGDLADKVNEATDGLPAKAQNTAGQAFDKAKDISGDLPSNIKKGADNAAGKAKDAAGNLPAKSKKAAQDAGEYIKNKTQVAKEQAPEKAAETGDQASKKAEATKDQAGKKAEEAKDEASKKAEETKDQAGERAADPKKELGNKAEETKKKASEKANDTQDDASEIAGEVKDDAKKAGPDSKEDAIKKGNAPNGT